MECGTRLVVEWAVEGSLQAIIISQSCTLWGFNCGSTRWWHLPTWPFFLFVQMFVCVRVCVCVSLSHKVSFSCCMFCNTPVVWALSVVFHSALIEFDTDGGWCTACFSHGHSVLVPQVQLERVVDNLIFTKHVLRKSNMRKFFRSIWLQLARGGVDLQNCIFTLSTHHSQPPV